MPLRLRRFTLVGLALATAVSCGGLLQYSTPPAQAASTRTTGAPAESTPDSCTTLICYKDAVGATVLKTQDALFEFNAALQGNPLSPLGYAGSVDDPSNGTVTVYWHGDVPSALNLDSLGSKLGLAVSVKKWSLSASDSDSLASKVTQSLHSSPLEGLTPSLIGGFDGDFDGLTVQGSYNTSDTATLTRALQTRMATLSSVPVRLVYNPGQAYRGRYDDTSPYWGGDLMLAKAENEICSTGFAYSYSSSVKTTTARHCREDDFTDYSDNTRTFGGTEAYGAVGQSRLMVGNGGGYVWDGTTLSSTASEGVQDYTTPTLGDHVCTDGGNGGLHCSLSVVNVSAHWDDGYGSQTIDIAQRESDNGAAIQGDSGGPVIAPVPDPSSEVHAVGMIQAGFGQNYEPNCGFTPKVANTGNDCDKQVGFTTVGNIISGLRTAGKAVSLQEN